LLARLGEAGESGMVRTPYKSAHKRTTALEGNEGAIDWANKVMFGQRR
jgi:hypothetical protein